MALFLKNALAIEEHSGDDLGAEEGGQTTDDAIPGEGGAEASTDDVVIPDEGDDLPDDDIGEIESEQGDLDDLSGEIDNDDEEITDMDDSITAMEAIADVVRYAISEKNGLDPHTAALADIAVEGWTERDPTDPSMGNVNSYEAYGVSKTKLHRSKLSYEAIDLKIGQMMSGLMDKLKAMMDRFFKWLSEIFGQAARVKRRLTKLKETASKATGSKKSETLKGGFISKLAIGDKIDAPAAGRELVSFSADFAGPISSVVAKNADSLAKAVEDGKKLIADKSGKYDIARTLVKFPVADLNNVVHTDLPGNMRYVQAGEKAEAGDDAGAIKKFMAKFNRTKYVLLDKEGAKKAPETAPALDSGEIVSLIDDALKTLANVEKAKSDLDKAKASVSAFSKSGSDAVKTLKGSGEFDNAAVSNYKTLLRSCVSAMTSNINGAQKVATYMISRCAYIGDYAKASLKNLGEAVADENGDAAAGAAA